MKEISTYIKKHPRENILVTYMFAGHGLVHKGAQTVLINEFDPKTGYYRLFLVEQLMRAMSTNYHNSYHVAFFPCCREISKKDKHCGCFGPTKVKA